ncbi:PaaI family thioesterase [Chitinophaga nivalis]|uniref:PaaI family thioesterase n=1 Tax=Chitinophaga nivalis TaxID=2991709 RepID=A0ABT3IM62_9BACT|nr:PaaI family thioesterase [Chitinophaga nivalis]MCW3465246.1 PaaI family thioesterase [Chitinophaga nivalis]MCW3485062.1 PaaI family thioesterase [Chitinophaga nivalis]
MEKLSPAIEQRTLESFARQRLMTLYGATVSGLAPGFMEISVLPMEALLRTSGIFHGGVLAALADTAAGYAAATMQPQDTSFLTVEFKINFLHTAKGEKLLASGKVLKAGSTLTVCQADLYTVQQDVEKHVATALVTLMKAR